MDWNEDSDKMKPAIERLDAERIRYRKTSAFQPKVCPYNFYPDTGTIFMDGAGRCPEGGLNGRVTSVFPLIATTSRTRRQVAKVPTN
jgi:hypothetical protein